jgi:presenilin-like A22 family membrane protease
MKHNWQTTLLLTLIFLVVQIIGVITAAYAYTGVEEGTAQPPTGMGERPDLAGWQSIVFLLAGIAVSTTIILYLAKHNKVYVWQAWYFLATFIATYLFFSVYTADTTAALLALAVTATRQFTNNAVAHNLVELIMYAGIAVFLAPLFTVNAGVVLLAVMAAYDIWAVNHTGHMVTLADFTRQTSNFPGVNLAPNATPSSKTTTKTDQTITAGVIGGGDLLFPLLFTITVFAASLTTTTLTTAMTYAAITIAGSTTGLLTLFVVAQRHNYYPALPFLATGCFAALLIIRTIHAAF